MSSFNTVLIDVSNIYLICKSNVKHYTDFTALLSTKEGFCSKVTDVVLFRCQTIPEFES